MPPKHAKPKLLVFTVEANALDYLERASEFIIQADTNPKAWKWVVLALHGALYGFAIAACKGTDYQTVVRKKKRGAEHLISLDEALKICEDPARMGTLSGGLALKLTESQRYSIRNLKKTLRNNFEHFVPRRWAIEIHGLPQISMDVLDVVAFLAVKTFRYQHLNISQQRRVKSIVYQCKKRLNASQLHREVLKAEARNIPSSGAA